jgi:hypothetical protein
MNQSFIYFTLLYCLNQLEVNKQCLIRLYSLWPPPPVQTRLRPSRNFLEKLKKNISKLSRIVFRVSFVPEFCNFVYILVVKKICIKIPQHFRSHFRSQEYQNSPNLNSVLFLSNFSSFSNYFREMDTVDY